MDNPMTEQSTRSPLIKVWREAVPYPVVDFVYREFRLMRDSLLSMGSNEGYNDPTVPGCFSWYSPLCFETLSLAVKDRLEHILKAELHSTYSSGRIYTNGSELVEHTDRRSSEIACSVNLAKDDDWGLFFRWKGQELRVDLEPGDMVIYSGAAIPHWRNKYTGQEHVQAFLQYVYADGEFSDLKYDTRPYLATPYAMTAPHIQDEVKNYV